MVRRTSLIVSEIIAGLLAGMVALGGLVAWRLHTGPIPLDFLTPHLEEALKSEGRGYTVDIDETIAVWAGWRNAVDIIATDVVVTAPDGSMLARVPELSLGLSLRALAWGTVAPTSLEAIGPSIRVIRQEDGEFALGFTDAPVEDDAVPAEAAAGMDVVDFLVDELLADPDPSRSFGYLRRVSILGGRVVVDDRVADKLYFAPDAEIILRKDRRGIAGDARLRLRYGEREADFAVRTGIEKDGLEYFAALDFSELQPGAFATSFPPQLSGVTALNMPLSGSVNLSGKLRGELERVDFDLLGARGKLELIDLYREPLTVESLRIRGSAAADFSSVRVEQAVVDLGDVTAFATAGLEPVREGPGRRFTLSAHMEDFEMRELHRFWPVSAEPKAREWVTQNIYEGIVDKGTIELALILGKDGPAAVDIETLEGTLAYTDLGISYFKQMTPVVGVDGQGTFDQHGFYLGVEEGTLAENIRVTGGKVDVLDMDKKGETRLVIDAHAEGPVATALDVLSEDPLNYGAKLGFDPATVGGSSVSDLRFELPLVKNLTGDMLEVAADARLTGVSTEVGPFDLSVSEGLLDLKVSGEDMILSGEVRLNQVPASVVWKENFEGAVSFRRQFEVSASPDGSQRTQLGLPDLSYWVKGTAPTALTYTVPHKGEPKLTVRTDLKDALVRVPEAAWKKEPGQPGQLEIEARLPSDGPLTIDRLHLNTADADGTLGIEFEPDMSDIAKVTLRGVRYGKNDVQGVITRMDGGGYRIELEGDRIDAQHFLGDEYETLRAQAESGPGGEAEDARPLHIKANFREIVTGEGGRMYRGAFNGIYNGEAWEGVVLYATLGEGGELKVNYGKGERGYELLVESNDAGQALQSLDWWGEIQGGSMVIEGRRATIDGPLVCDVWVKDFRMIEAPAGIKLLQIITLVGLPAAAAAGEGISFAGLEGTFSYDKGLLTLGEIEAWGPVGVHVDRGGWMDFNKERIEMRGVVVPVNTLQKVLGFLPVVGFILGDGLIAANFEVSGKLEDPKVAGSPASVFLPGFLRKLFRLKPDEDDDGTDKPGAEPPVKRD